MKPFCLSLPRAAKSLISDQFETSNRRLSATRSGQPAFVSVSTKRLHLAFDGTMAARGRTHLGLVTIIVESYDTAIDYFTNKLGFVLVEDSPATKTASGEAIRWFAIQRPGQNSRTDTSILLAQADGPEQHANIGKQFAGRVGMFLYV